MLILFLWLYFKKIICFLNLTDFFTKTIKFLKKTAPNSDKYSLQTKCLFPY